MVRAVFWHLIGPLQRNKARHAVGAFSLLHGVDNARLLAEIDRRARAQGVRQAVLLQVRLGGEEAAAWCPAPRRSGAGRRYASSS